MKSFFIKLGTYFIHYLSEYNSYYAVYTGAYYHVLIYTHKSSVKVTSSFKMSSVPTAVIQV